MITIYCHTHIATGRCYIGQTRQTMEQRWRAHVKDAQRGTCRAFQRAIVKYGPDAFAHVVLDVVAEERANDAEREWIGRLNTLVPCGFNLDTGGAGGGAKHPETRRRMSRTARLVVWTKRDADARRASAEKGHANRAPGKPSAAALAQWAAKSPEERATVARKGHANRVSGQFSATWAAMSPERKAEIARKKAETRAKNARAA